VIGRAKPEGAQSRRGCRPALGLPIFGTFGGEHVHTSVFAEREGGPFVPVEPAGKRQRMPVLFTGPPDECTLRPPRVVDPREDGVPARVRASLQPAPQRIVVLRESDPIRSQPGRSSPRPCPGRSAACDSPQSRLCPDHGCSAIRIGEQHPLRSRSDDVVEGLICAPGGKACSEFPKPSNRSVPPSATPASSSRTRAHTAHAPVESPSSPGVYSRHSRRSRRNCDVTASSGISRRRRIGARGERPGSGRALRVSRHGRGQRAAHSRERRRTVAAGVIRCRRGVQYVGLAMAWA
jgi:hypothetical protein